MAIGQGDCLVSPLQVARGMAVVANAGSLVRPRLIARVEGEPSFPAPVHRRPLGLRKETIAALRAGTEAAVSPGGTAASIATPRYRIAGKTGSAQVPDGSAHAWFAGYAPSESPKIAVAVIVEHGRHGGAVAGPIARHVFDVALLPEAERPKLPPRKLTLASSSAPEN